MISKESAGIGKGTVINMKPLSVYIHIPFCVKKCLYCDFLSEPAGEEIQERYLSSLIKEIKLESKSYVNYKIHTVFIGGGTPSAVNPQGIREIMDTLRAYYAWEEAAEVSIEVNPGTVTAQKLAVYRESGINRLSIGAQSAVKEELKALGRIHTPEDIETTYEMAVKAGFNNINIDLMSAIPLQTEESYRHTLKKVLSFSPAPVHLSAYSLIVEEGTPFYENTPSLPEEDMERRLYKITNDILSKKGYRRYEISNYAKPGYECRHNLVYWQREDYVGFGTGSASLIEETRFHNSRDREAYVNQLEQAETREELRLREEMQELTKEEQMEEFMFLGLRLSKGISTKTFYETFGKTVEEVYPGLTEKLCRQGLLIREAWGGREIRLRLSEYGIDVSNVVMAEFLLT